MTRTEQARRARIAQARAFVLHCHTQLHAWADNRDPVLTDLRRMAVDHYTAHKARGLQNLRALLCA